MKKESYSSMALNAMHRASKEAIEKATKLDLKIPVWKNGQIIFNKEKSSGIFSTNKFVPHLL